MQMQKKNQDFAFPVFAPGLPSVYERAGFDVNRSGSRSPSLRSMSSFGTAPRSVSGTKLNSGLSSKAQSSLSSPSTSSAPSLLKDSTKNTHGSSAGSQKSMTSLSQEPENSDLALPKPCVTGVAPLRSYSPLRREVSAPGTPISMGDISDERFTEPYETTDISMRQAKETVLDESHPGSPPESPDSSRNAEDDSDGKSSQEFHDARSNESLSDNAGIDEVDIQEEDTGRLIERLPTGSDKGGSSVSDSSFNFDDGSTNLTTALASPYSKASETLKNNHSHLLGVPQQDLNRLSTTSSVYSSVVTPQQAPMSPGNPWPQRESRWEAIPPRNNAHGLVLPVVKPSSDFEAESASEAASISASHSQSSFGTDQDETTGVQFDERTSEYEPTPVETTAPSSSDGPMTVDSHDYTSNDPYDAASSTGQVIAGNAGSAMVDAKDVQHTAPLQTHRPVPDSAFGPALNSRDPSLNNYGAQSPNSPSASQVGLNGPWGYGSPHTLPFPPNKMRAPRAPLPQRPHSPHMRQLPMGPHDSPHVGLYSQPRSPQMLPNMMQPRLQQHPIQQLPIKSGPRRRNMNALGPAHSQSANGPEPQMVPQRSHMGPQPVLPAGAGPQLGSQYLIPQQMPHPQHLPQQGPQYPSHHHPQSQMQMTANVPNLYQPRQRYSPQNRISNLQHHPASPRPTMYSQPHLHQPVQMPSQFAQHMHVGGTQLSGQGAQVSPSDMPRVRPHNSEQVAQQEVRDERTQERQQPVQPEQEQQPPEVNSELLPLEITSADPHASVYVSWGSTGSSDREPDSSDSGPAETSLDTEYSDELPPPVAVGKVCRGCLRGIHGKAMRSKDGHLSGRWHRECFRCTRCADPLATDAYVKDNQPFCQGCYHHVNHTLCATCGLGVEGECLETQDDSNRLYHAACLMCAKCLVPLRQSYFLVGSETLCAEHAFTSLPADAKLERRYTRFVVI